MLVHSEHTVLSGVKRTGKDNICSATNSTDSILTKNAQQARITIFSDLLQEEVGSYRKAVFDPEIGKAFGMLSRADYLEWRFTHKVARYNELCDQGIFDRSVLQRNVTIKEAAINVTEFNDSLGVLGAVRFGFGSLAEQAELYSGWLSRREEEAVEVLEGFEGDEDTVVPVSGEASSRGEDVQTGDH